MHTEIRRKSDYTEDIVRALEGLAKAAYPPREEADEAYSQVEWAATTWSVLVWNDRGELVSHVGVLTRNAKHNDLEVLLGGIGGVKTHPHQQGRGYAGAGLVRAASFLCDERLVAYSLLVCRAELLPFYRRYGWREFEGDLLVQQSSGRTKFTLNRTMVLDGQQIAPRQGVIDLCGMPW